jgi:hypothetical protein
VPGTGLPEVSCLQTFQANFMPTRFILQPAIPALVFGVGLDEPCHFSFECFGLHGSSVTKPHEPDQRSVTNL